MMADDFAQTRLDMAELGWFGTGPAFWRWVNDDAALPYIKICAAMRRPIGATQFDLDERAEAIISDPVKLDKFAAWIETTFSR